MKTLGRRITTAGLIAALGLMVGVDTAQAGRGIIVKNPVITPVGDPLAEYNFTVDLAGRNELLPLDFLTIHDIPDFGTNPHFNFVPALASFAADFKLIATAGSSAGLTDIQFLFDPTTTPFGLAIRNTGTTPLTLGHLIVPTTVQFPPDPSSPLFNPLKYTTQTHLIPGEELNFDDTGVLFPHLVPEPASLALAGLGLAGAGAWAMARGRVEGRSRREMADG